MKTLRSFLALGLAVAGLGACSEGSQFKVEGSIDGAPDSVLYLHQMAISGPVVVDSVRLGSDGHFCFKAEAPAAPEFYVLRIGDQIINLSVDSTETITVRAQYPGMASRYEVEGSDNCETIRQLALKQQALHQQVVALEKVFSGQQLADTLERIVEAYKKDVTMNYIYKAPDKASSYFALFQTLGQLPIFNPHASRDDMRVFGAVATSWDTYYPESERTQNLRNITLRSMNEARTVAARQNQTIDTDKIITSGVVDLQLPDTKGNLRSLTELKGKVVLLDFHVFGTKESAARILELRDLYNKYHDRGLEIFQVGLSDDDHWWRQSVDNLPWVNVLDQTGASAARYNVQSLGEFFILDRSNTLQSRVNTFEALEHEINRFL